MRKLSDLNNHLFAQLERIGDEDLNGEELQAEIERSKAMAGVAKEIVSNAKLAFDVAVKYDEMSMSAKQHVDTTLLGNKQ